MEKTYEDHVNEMRKDLIERVTREINEAMDTLVTHKPADSLVGTSTLVFAVQDGRLQVAGHRMRIEAMEDASPAALMALGHALMEKSGGVRTVIVNGQVKVDEDTRRPAH